MLVTGGYPEAQGRSQRGRTRFFSSYIASIIGRDLDDIANSPRPPRPTASPAATSHPTPCSPSSKRSDYANPQATTTTPKTNVNITQEFA
jgi:hypothetical protein